MKKIKFFLCVLSFFFGMLSFAQHPQWEVVDGFEHTMTLHAKIKVDNNYIVKENSSLAAYKDGICRGVTTIFDGPSGDQFQLSIGSNSEIEKDIQLKVYDGQTDSIYDIEASVEFKVNSTIGTIESPVVYFNKDLGIIFSDYVEVGKYKIYADDIVKLATSEYLVEGNVQINDYIKIKSKLKVNVDEFTVSGDGLIFLDKIPVVEQIDVYSGSFVLELTDGINFKEYASEKMSIMLSKLPVDVDRMYLIEGGVLIYGDLKLPKIINKVDAEIKTLEITRQHGLRLLGTVSVKDVKIHSINLDTLGLTFNTIDDYFSAAAHLTTPFFGIGATTEIISGNMNFVHIDVSPPHPVPFAATGFSISEISGGVDNISAPPLELMVSIDLVPTLQGNFEIVKLNNLSLNYTWGKEFSGSGELQLFDQNLANVYLNIQTNKVAFGGAVSLFDVFSGNIDASIFKHGEILMINGRLYAALSIPAKDGFPFDIVNSLIELPYVVAETDNYLSNNIIAGNTKILHFKMNYKAEWENRQLSIDYGRGYENWNEIIFGNSNLLKLKNASTNRFEGQSLIINNQSTQSQLKKSSLGYEQVFSIQQESPTMIVRIDQDNQLPRCKVKMPGGQIISETNVNNTSQFYSVNVDERKVFFQFDNPPQGEWTIIAENMSEDIKVDIIGAEISSSLFIDSIRVDGSNVTIPCRAYTKNNEATLSFYYDDDNTGFNGVKMADVENIIEYEELNWNTIGMPNGKYYIYGVLNDYNNTTVRVYSPNTITVSNVNTPNNPTDLVYSIDNDTLILEWKYNSDPDITFNVYYSTSSEFDNRSKSFNSGSKMSMHLPDLTSGRSYYFAVTAVNADGLESEHSEPLFVLYNKQNKNNFPYITEVIVPDVIYPDSSFIGQVYAIDSDNDFLSFSLNNEPKGISINSDGILKWKPGIDDIGIHSFTVIVADDDNAKDSSLLTVTVKNNLVELPELVSNKTIYSSFCDLPIITLTDGMLTTHENRIDSIKVRISNGSNSTDKFFYEQSLNSKFFSGTLDIDDLRDDLKILSSDTLYLTYSNYKYNTNDSISIIINDRFNNELLNLEGSYVLDSGSYLNVSALAGFKHYEWYKKGKNEPVSFNKDYSISSGGDYYVKVKDEFGCFAISELISIYVTGVEDLSAGKLILFNYSQTSNDLYIKLSDRINTVYKLEIYNTLGQLILNRNIVNIENTVNLSSLPKGQYYIALTNDFERLTKKIIIF